MKELFAISYALLWGFIVLEAVLLQNLLRRTVWYKQLHVDFRRHSMPEQLTMGMAAPEFTAPLLGTGRTLSTTNLKGLTTILLFVSPLEASSSLYKNMVDSIHALWHKAGGNLFLVCSGGEEACRQIALDHHLDGFRHGQIPVILDEGGRIAQSFHISKTPQAVMLDDDALVSRCGHPVPTKEDI